MNNIDNINGKSDFSVLPMSAVMSELFLKDSCAARKWLKINNVPIYKFTNKFMVYKMQFECALALPFAKELRKKEPFKWKDILSDICNNNVLYSLILLEIGVGSQQKPTTKVLPKNNKEKELLNRLSQ